MGPYDYEDVTYDVDDGEEDTCLLDQDFGYDDELDGLHSNGVL